ncbi:MAG: hypothetical protein ABI781_18185 [Burkholderiales bacterium]
MKFLAFALFCATGLPLAHAAPGTDQPASPRDLHAAECVAALDVDTQALANEVKSGKEASRALLLDRLIAGTAFVGDTYLHGGSDEKQARALANEALAAQKSLPPAELTARQAACAAEGRKLYDDSNGLERAVVKRLANKRMQKLLGG